jgi:hypothetical protein
MALSINQLVPVQLIATSLRVVWDPRPGRVMHYRSGWSSAELERGARIAERVATPELFVGLGSPAEPAYSRFKGYAGLALVAAGPRDPMPSAMPMFEPELAGRRS